MAIYDLWLSRNNGPTVANYVGHAGRLFFDPTERILRISDGTTAGGEVFNGIVTVTATEPTQNFEGQVWLNPETYELSIYHDGDFIPTIDVATETKLGGVKLGPGVTVNGEGQIIIDSSGLDFSFGDFAAIVGEYTDETEYALLSSIKQDEDIVLASNGNGDIKVVGGFEVYATDGSVTASLEDAEPFFRILEDGQVRILVPLADTTEGGLEIIGSELGTSLQPGIAGTMLHLTGNPDLPTRVYHDTLGDYSSYVFRRYNGSVVTATQVLANEDIGRINWTAATNAGMGNTSTAQIRVTALENQTTSTQGSKITFTVTPVGSPAISRVDVATITVADGVSATKFTGPLTGNVTGTATTATNAVQLQTARTINGVSFNGTANINVANTQTLTAGTYLTGTGTYDGSTARTFAVDATTTSTASKVVARDSNGDFAARHISAKIKHATRDAGSVNGGLTINYNTDDWIVGTFTTDFTITHSNLSAGMGATVVLYNSSGTGSDDITFGVGTENNTYQTSSITVNDTNLIILKFYSFGTTTADLYCEVNYRDLE